MARMPLLAAAAAGGRRHLVDLWATAPSAYNWQEPLGQAPIPAWRSWPRDIRNFVVFTASLLALFLFCCGLKWLFCRARDDDTCRDVGGPWAWSNNDVYDDDGEAVSAPPPWQQQDEQPPSTSWDDGYPPQSNNGEGGRSPRRQRRRRQRPAPTEELPAAHVEMAMGGMSNVELTEAHFGHRLAPAADEEIAPVADMEEMAPAQEPAPTLKCTFSTAEGWAEGTCSVCLSELVDGEKVRVLTACMHCFHAICVEKWLRENATCPLCRAPAMAVPARGRRRRGTQTAVTADQNVSLAY